MKNNTHRDFCSLAAHRVGENLFATAPYTNRFILIEYNHAWEEKVLENNKAMEQEVKDYLNNNIEKNHFARVFLIKNHESKVGCIRVFLVNNQQVNPFIKPYIISSYRELLDIDFAHAFEWDSSCVTEPMYLVCTHGKVDMCCSKFGLPILKLLTDYGANVWQCTHVTGDRFAPNVVQVPYGYYYGHLKLEEMLAFYKSLCANEIYFPKYRGRNYNTRHQQAAEYFLRKHLNDFGYDNLLFQTQKTSIEQTSFEIYHVPTSQTYEVVIDCVQSEEQYFMNCLATERKPVEVYSLISLSKLVNEQSLL